MAQRPHLLSIAFVLAAFMAAPAVYAQSDHRRGNGDVGPGGPGGPGGLPGFLGPEMLEQLGLDDLQQQLIQELRDEMRDDLEPVHAELRELKSHMEELWTADFPDREAILSLGEWLDVLRSVIRERRVELRLDILDILSDEQRLLLAELTAEQESEREHRRGGGPDGRGRRGPADDSAGFDDGEGARGMFGEIGFDEPDGSEEIENDGRTERRENRRGRRGGLADKLDLDEMQRAELRALRAEMREQTMPIREVMRELRQEMKTLWSSGWPDEEAIFEVGEDMDFLRGMLREERVDFRLALIDLLTPEQRALFDEEPHVGRRGRRGNARI